MIQSISAVLVSILCLPIAGAQTRLKPVIRQVDHILIRADDPQGLFDFFAKSLELPVAWPISEYPGFTSGGVAAGNVNLEVLQYAGARIAAKGKRPEGAFIGLALQPYQLSDCLLRLRERGIDFEPEVRQVSNLPDGSEGTLWTTVTLSRLSSPGMSVFLCEYSPAFLNVEIRRNQLGGQLALRRGGPLGVKSVKEIVIGTPDLAAEKAAWGNLLSRATPPNAAFWVAGTGPSIRLTSGNASRIASITLRVESLSSAKDWLERNRMLGAVTAGSVSIKPSSIQGLDIRLVQK